MKKGTLLVAVILAAASVCPARTITVDDDGPADFNNIQAAIDTAADSDTIEIQPGTYNGPGNYDIAIEAKDVTVTSTDPNDPDIVAATVVDCQWLGGGFYIHNAAPILSGLTIINAHGASMPSAAIHLHGGAPVISNCVLSHSSSGIRIEASESHPQTGKIINCRITANNSGGIVRSMAWPATTRCDITVADCIISDNNNPFGIGYAVYETGGEVRGCTITRNSNGVLGCGAVRNCTITDNTSGSGVGNCDEVTDCTIARNYSSGVNQCRGDISNCVITDNGGCGIAICGGIIRGCTITGNGHEERSPYGGGICCGNDLITSRIENCVISGNTASWGGGIACVRQSPEIVNCIIGENHALEFSGAVFLYFDETLNLSNCTIIGNTPNICSRGKLNLTSCIAWENGPSYLSSGSTASWSNIQGGWAGVGNIDIDPRLTGNFHLRADSPCINAGNPAYAPDPCDADIDGEFRVFEARVDMGADEFVDSDRDGLPDWWEQDHFGSPAGADPGENPDGDLLTNVEEYKLSFDPLTPSDYYVDPVDGNDLWDALGGAWDGVHGPKKTIQSAIDACPVGRVVLTRGVYSGRGNRDLDLRGKRIVVTSLDPRDPDIVAATVIDCVGEPDRHGSQRSRHRAFHLQSKQIYNSVITGLTITNGDAANGGAILLEDYASPTISFCNIIGNHADGYGGAIYADEAYPVIAACLIANNDADKGGGIAANPRNGSPREIVRCTFRGNRAEVFGGALYEISDALITDCVMVNNTAYGYGGAIYLFPYRLDVRNCIIAGNRADRGGAIAFSGVYDIYRLNLVNSVITGNRAIKSHNSIRPDGPLNVTLTQCIVWANGAVPTDLSINEVAFSNIEGGHAGTGNIEADPLFADPGHWEDPNTPEDFWDDTWVEGDYHLKSQAGRYDPSTRFWARDDVISPCIDTGNPLSPIGREPFPNGGVVNMGAYGTTAEASKSYFGIPPCDIIVAGDINGDCEVNFADFQLMALHWCEDNSQ